MAVKTFTQGEKLSYTDTNTYLNNGGLVYVTQTTVGNAVTSVTMTNCFSSEYDNYFLTYTGGSNSSSGTDLYLQLRTSGGSTSTTGYYSALIYSTMASGTPQAYNLVNGSSFANIGASLSTTTPFIAAELYSPNLARRTLVRNTFIRADAMGTVQAYHDVATAYSSCVIGPILGTITGGVIRVYGMRQA